MIVKDVINCLEGLAPLAHAEDFDNVGLLVGNANREVSGILVTLDTLETVVDEAIDRDCNLIVSFHPIIFKGLKSLTGKNYVERTVLKAIKNDIAIFAIHTALDNVKNGVNGIISDKLNLTNKQILIPKKSTIKKLTTYVPANKAEHLRKALFSAGAGSIGNYDHCSFNAEGVGTYRGNESSNPTIGNKGELHEENEIQISMTFSSHLESKVLEALFKNHPYEEVAFEITTLDNSNQDLGMGMIGELEVPIKTVDFFNQLKTTFYVSVIRHSQIIVDKIKKTFSEGIIFFLCIQQEKIANTPF
ncbi:MAG: Nif3-like dinuclear metal center hexameric protein [Bacteroidota bacterium]